MALFSKRFLISGIDKSMARITIAASLSGLAASGLLAAGLPDPEPILRIESGMHVGPIVRIGTDKDCRLMVTGSKDKTARLWSLPAGGKGQPTLLKTLRVPIGDGDEGKIFAVALSPDGKLVAAGGWDIYPEMNADHAIYIFDAQTGKILHRLDGLGSNIRQLVFSPGSKYLAGTISSNKGLKVWDTQSWSLVGQDVDYGGDSYGAAFGADGTLYTVAFDGFIRKYGTDFKLEAKAKTIGNARPFTVAIDPSGDRFAVGFDMSPFVEVYSSKDLSRLYVPSMEGYPTGDSSSVAWSADGTRLFAAGKYGSGERRPIRIWQNRGLGATKDVFVARNNIDELLTCGSGVAFGTDEPAFGLINANGERTAWRDNVIVDAYQKVGKNFAISQDGKRIRFGLGMGGRDPVMFDLSLGKLTNSATLPADLLPPDVTDLPITNWHDALAPRLADKPLKTDDAEYSHSLAIAPVTHNFVLGMEWHLRAFDKDGTPLWTKPSPAGVAWGVNVSGDGRFVVVAYGDGTFRWYKVESGEEVVALFVNAKNREWVMWTPQGYYNSSPHGDRYIGWHLNKGLTSAGEFVSAAQLRGHYFRPDVVKQVVALGDPGRAYAELVPNGFRLAELSQRKVPTFNIVSPSAGALIASESTPVAIEVEANADPITGFDVTVNGRQVTTDDNRSAGDDGRASYTKTFKVPLEQGENLVRIKATNEVGETSKELQISTSKRGLLDKRGTLYLVAVGVDDYKNFSHLNFAGADAKGFTEAITSHVVPLHRNVQTRILARGGDGEPTRANIEDALDLFKKANEEDTVMLFLAGHGVNDGPDYLFIPQDAAVEDGHWKSSTVVKWSVLQSALENAKGRRLMFVDTCHAGGAYNARLIKDATDAEIVVFSATDGETLAQELSSIKHGVFSFSLIQGLNGKADVYHRGSVYILDLGSYVSHEVEQITSNSQAPTFNLANSKNFILAYH